MIKNIIFDLDDTLFDFHLAEKIAITRTLAHLEVEATENILKRYSEINLSQWKLLELGEISRDEVKVRRFKILFDEFSIDKNVEYANKCYQKFLATGHYFIDGALELIETLSKDYRLYIASNGGVDIQKSRIASADITKYLDRIFISQEVGFDKPDIEFFKRCFAEIPDFRRDETLILGDSLSSDIKGGKNAGIITVWFNPGRVVNTSDIVPHYEIHRLLELIPLLKEIK